MNPSEASARATLRDAASQTLIDLASPGADPLTLARRLKAVGGMVEKDLGGDGPCECEIYQHCPKCDPEAFKSPSV